MTSRISQSMLYTNFVNYLNQTTTSLQQLYEQGSTQKKINEPSDNPVGMARILSYRDSIKALTQYQENINNSKGWLGLADTTLKEVEDQLTRLKELTVQASTGTINESDRKDILNEVKQIFDQLLSLANTTYEGRSIFAGHKIDQPAYQKALAVYSNLDDTNPAYQYVREINGYTDETLVIEFSEKTDSNGNSITDPDGDGFAQVGIDDGIQYRVLKGDGELISSGELNSGDTTIDLGEVTIDLKKGYKVAVNKLTTINTSSFTNTGVKTTAYGNISGDVDIRIEEVSGTGFGIGDQVTYMYSEDGGQSWIKATAQPSSSGILNLSLPDGTLRIEQLTTDASLIKGDRFQLTPIIVRERTQLVIAPTAIYQGDNESGTGVEIINGTTSTLNLNIIPDKNGSFHNPVLVKIASGGNVGDGNPVEYQYSFDGGVTWSDNLVADNNDPNKLELELPGGKITLTPMDTTLPQSLTGLSFKIGGIEVNQVSTNLYAFAEGDIKQNIMVRIDNVSGTGFTTGDEIEYSYSTDGGITWDSGHKITATGSRYETLPIEGGLLKIASSTVTSALSSGDLFTIRPRDASMDSEIYQGVNVSVTHIGSEIFGGFYQNASGMEMAFAQEEKNNLFVGVGKLIASLELNNQENISACLDYIDAALKQVSKVHVGIGAKLNRLNTSESILTDLKLNQTERKSFLEDVDFAELLTKISQQQTVYQAILKSASMIMKVSLVNYV